MKGREMNSLISVIVPVYNVEQYLEECIVSLVNQTYKNIEIIILSTYAFDSSISIFDKSNSSELNSSELKLIFIELISNELISNELSCE